MRKPRHRVTRKRTKREPYDRVLIMCEGEKTEPKYFSEIVQYYKLNTANVQVVGAGVDPLTIIRKAKEWQQKERKTGEKYDRVYCVFDCDEHVHFQQASFLAQRNNFWLARSCPCFEFWLLLHFCFTRRPYSRSQGRSPGENCIRDLRRYWPDYKKAGDGVFLHLRHALEKARENADRTEVDAQQTGNINPSTEVHRLVTFLEMLKEV